MRIARRVRISGANGEFATTAARNDFCLDAPLVAASDDAPLAAREGPITVLPLADFLGGIVPGAPFVMSH